MLGWSRGRLRVISAGPQPHVFLSTQRGPGAAACQVGSRLGFRNTQSGIDASGLCGIPEQMNRGSACIGLCRQGS